MFPKNKGTQYIVTLRKFNSNPVYSRYSHFHSCPFNVLCSRFFPPSNPGATQGPHVIFRFCLVSLNQFLTVFVFLNINIREEVRPVSFVDSPSVWI